VSHEESQPKLVESTKPPLFFGNAREAIPKVTPMSTEAPP